MFTVVRLKVPDLWTNLQIDLLVTIFLIRALVYWLSIEDIQVISIVKECFELSERNLSLGLVQLLHLAVQMLDWHLVKMHSF